MLSCPICLTSLDDDSCTGGRCLNCGSQVVWQNPAHAIHEYEAELLAASTMAAARESSLLAEQGVTAGLRPQRESERRESGMEQATREPSPVASATPAWMAPISSQPNSLPRHSLPPDGLPPHSLPPHIADADRLGAAKLTKPKSRHLSLQQNQAIRSLWQGTLDSAATPLTSLRASAIAEATRKSSLVIRSRELTQRVEGRATLGADYELLDQIGQGGMGVVYNARQASIDRIVAVKMLRREIADLTEPRDKFLSEAVVTAELDHPNIVPIHDLGTSAEGALFYSMKRVQGTPWCDALLDKSLADNLAILLKVCDAVAFAHTRGVIHRDLKPENVMLGDFGEVLVMDWGLAVATTTFRCPESITQSSSMGGTPAYMAPEMATGPIGEINEQSDIYLLGAILYEILTGQPPHFGKDPMDCLLAAAANRIQPTTKSGELLDIAMKSMSTEPMDRHQTVKAFQEAIRHYQSHAESILLSDRAAAELDQARESGDYQKYAAAVHGFREAGALWNDNPAAGIGLVTAKLAYAKCAEAKEDYDLAASLLDPQDPDQQLTLQGIEAKRRERKSRQQRIRTMRHLAIGSMGLVIVIGALAVVMIQRDRNQAVAARQVAVEKMKEAETAKQLEEEQREVAEQNQLRAEASKKEAEVAAKAAADNAEEARRQELEAARQSYAAMIGLAAARAEENAFREANATLDLLANSPFRHWEWGRLKTVCAGSARRWPTEGRVTSVAVDHVGNRVAAGTRQGLVVLWSLDTGERLLEIPHPGQWVHAVAISPDGRWLATGGSDRCVRLFDSESGQQLSEWKAHDDTILRVAFSPDGQELLTSSYDHTAAVWNLSELQHDELQRGELRQLLQGHSWWVHDAGFSPDGNAIVTAGQDGKVIVWTRSEASQPFAEKTLFNGHEGPVFAASFAPNGQFIVSGGQDKRVMVWDFHRQGSTSITDRLAGEPASPPIFRAFDGHRGAIRAVAFSHDGERIVSGSVDNTLHVWDVTTGAIDRTLRGHEREVRTATFATNDTSVVSGSFDDSVRIWDVGSYHESRIQSAKTVRGHRDAILDAGFSPLGDRIITASRDRTACVWQRDTGEQLRKFAEGHDYLAAAAEYFPDGKQLLTAGGDNTVRVWDLTTATEVTAISGTGRDGLLAIGPEGRQFLTGNGKVALVWDLPSQQVVCQLEGHQSVITAVSYSPDARHCATGDTSGVVIYWELESGTPVWTSTAHLSMITAMRFVDMGRGLVTASGDRTVAYWDCATGKERHEPLQHPAWISAMAVSEDGKRVITSCGDATVRIWMLGTGLLAGTLPVPATAETFAENLRREMRGDRVDVSQLAHRTGVPSQQIEAILAAKQLPDKQLAETLAAGLDQSVTQLMNPRVTSVAISSDGAYALTTVPDDRTVRCWRLDSLTEVPVPDKPVGTPLIDLRQETGLLWSARFSDDNARLVTLGGSDVRIWDLRTGEERVSLSPHGTVVSAQFSPDGQRAVTASWDDSAKVWDVSSGRAILKLAGQHQGNVNRAMFAPDGTQILTCSDDHTLRLWNATSGEPSEIVFRGHQSAVLSAAFFAEGKRMVSVSRDRTARVWDVQTGSELSQLRDAELAGSVTDGKVPSHQLGVLCVESFRRGPDEFLVTGGEDGVVKIWAAHSGALLHRLESHTSRVTTLAASPDGLRIVTGSQDATAKVWDAEHGKEILTLRGHSQEVTAARFSPDGLAVLTASRDGLAIVWPAEPWSDKATLTTRVPIGAAHYSHILHTPQQSLPVQP